MLGRERCLGSKGAQLVFVETAYGISDCEHEFHLNMVFVGTIQCSIRGLGSYE
jgi:hypothetical protein